MTCIVGIADKETGRVHLGGDAAGVAGTSLTHRADPKVFHVGEFVLGFTSSFRMGQLLQHSFVPPMPKKRENLERFMATRFIDAVRECMKVGGYASEKNDRESAGTFLVGFRGRLFCIDSDYQVGEALDGYDAVGAGSDVSKGSLFTSMDLPPEERLKVALEASERWCSAVRAPFLYVKTDPYKKAVKKNLSKSLDSE